MLLLPKGYAGCFLRSSEELPMGERLVSRKQLVGLRWRTADEANLSSLRIGTSPILLHGAIEYETL